MFIIDTSVTHNYSFGWLTANIKGCLIAWRPCAQVKLRSLKSHICCLLAAKFESLVHTDWPRFSKVLCRASFAMLKLSLYSFIRLQARSSLRSLFLPDCTMACGVMYMTVLAAHAQTIKVGRSSALYACMYRPLKSIVQSFLTRACIYI